MGRTWSHVVVSVSVLAVVCCEIRATYGFLNPGIHRALMQEGIAADLELEDMLDELGGPDAEAPAPEPELVVKLCPEPRVFVLEAFFNWTAARHPVNYPQNASWSPMFGAVHNENYEMFSFTQNASKAMEQVVEEGKGTLLKEEVEACIEEGNCRDYLEFKCDEKAGDCKMMGNFTVNTTFSRVSLIAMAKPSPDWFTGVTNLDLCNNGAWSTDIVLKLNASDAGTDEGKTFSSKNINIPVGDRGLIMEFDELSPENPFYNPDFVAIEFDEEGNEIENPTVGGLEEVIDLKISQNKETVDEDVGGGSDAVTVEDPDTDDLTEEQIKALKKKEASIRFIGPRNGCSPITGHILSVVVTFSLVILTTLF